MYNILFVRACAYKRPWNYTVERITRWPPQLSVYYPVHTNNVRCSEVFIVWLTCIREWTYFNGQYDVYIYYTKRTIQRLINLLQRINEVVSLSLKIVVNTTSRQYGIYYTESKHFVYVYSVYQYRYMNDTQYQ